MDLGNVFLSNLLKVEASSPESDVVADPLRFLSLTLAFIQYDAVLGAFLGKAPRVKSTLRVFNGGWLAMAITFGLTNLVDHYRQLSWIIYMLISLSWVIDNFGISIQGPRFVSKPKPIKVDSIVGTFGYLAMVYALYGTVIDKTNVYSFDPSCIHELMKPKLPFLLWQNSYMLKQGIGLSVLAPEISLSSLSDSLVFWAETTWAVNMRSFTFDKFDILKLSNLNFAKEGRQVLIIQIGVNQQVLYMHWSGAASTILDMCALYYDSIRECHAMENQMIKFGQTDGEQLEQEELILLGLIGLKCTTSIESIKSTLENLRNDANIQIKLVSEDDIMEVKAIACGLGLEHGIVLEGRKLKDLNEEAIRRSGSAHVLANFHPEDKLL
ncbi:hypothetical protein JHK82_024967 [Glycine max]|nr:hypothetical protein JHK82_024967 [Glycine max]